MTVNKMQSEMDLKTLIKAIKTTPEKFPNAPFGVSRIQRALKIGYGRAIDVQALAVERGILIRAKGTCKTELAKAHLTAQ